MAFNKIIIIIIIIIIIAIKICLISLKRGHYVFAWLQARPVSKKVGRLPSWWVQLNSPGTALTVGEWIRPGGQNYWGREGTVSAQPLQ